MNALIKLMRLNKPIGIWLLLWPSWQAAYLLTQTPDYKILIWLTLGTIVARSTGCVINDICDINFDSKVARTKQRPLACGAIKKQTAYIAAITGMLICLVIALQLPFMCWLLAIIAAGLIIIYPLSKRWFICPQLILGLAFAWPVLITTYALGYDINTAPWWLFISSIIWPIAYDTLYAMTDKQDDLKLNLHSSAKWLGSYDLTGVIVCYIFWSFCWLIIAWQQQSIIMLTGLIISIVILAPKILKATTPKLCFSAFKVNQYIGGILWLAIVWR